MLVLRMARLRQNMWNRKGQHSFERRHQGKLALGANQTSGALLDLLIFVTEIAFGASSDRSPCL